MTGISMSICAPIAIGFKSLACCIVVAPCPNGDGTYSFLCSVGTGRRSRKDAPCALFASVCGTGTPCVYRNGIALGDKNDETFLDDARPRRVVIRVLTLALLQSVIPIGGMTGNGVHVGMAGEGVIGAGLLGRGACGTSLGLGVGLGTTSFG